MNNTSSFEIAAKAMRRDSGHCWVVSDCDLPYGDDDLLQRRSTLRLLEDGKLLGPPHTPRADVQSLGGGAYCHWMTNLYFSTSDNSDPRENGRRYTALIQQRKPLAGAVEADVQAVVADIKRGGKISRDRLTAVLEQPNMDERANVFCAIGNAFLEAGKREQAIPQFWRAWQLGDHRREVYYWALKWLYDKGTDQDRWTLMREAAIAAEAAGDMGWMVEILLQFHSSIYRAYSGLRPVAAFQDTIITGTAARMLNHVAPESRPLVGRPLRIGYLLAGEAEERFSSLPEIAVEFITNHEHPGADACAISLYSEADLLARNPFFSDLRERMRAAKRNWHFLPSVLGNESRLATARRLSNAIAALDLDVLVVFVLTGWNFLIAAQRPARLVASLGLGEVQLYTAPMLDLTVHFSHKPSMDGLSRTAMTTTRFLPQSRMNGHPSPLTRAALGIPDQGLLLMASGRAVKFHQAAFWDIVGRILTARPTVRLALVGLDSEGFAEIVKRFSLPPSIIPRLHCLGWRNDALAVIGRADIVIDTFPFGGGISLFEPMTQGIPVVLAEDDYFKPFAEPTWTPAGDYFAEGQFGCHQDDCDGLVNRVIALIDDPDLRAAVGEECRVSMEQFQYKAQCAKEIETIFIDALARRACET